MTSAAQRDIPPRPVSGDSAAGDSVAGEADPSDLCAAELGWGLSRMMRAFGLWASASVIDLPGGPRGHLVLASISRSRPPSQLALANQLGLDRTVMTYLLDELEAAGLIERRPDPSDRRARQIQITDAGRTALREYGGRLLEAENRLLAPLDPQEAAAFRQMIERIARAADAAPDAGNPCGEQSLPSACSGP
jgi:DNA-binding MarR family transcriptional regulator